MFVVTSTIKMVTLSKVYTYKSVSVNTRTSTSVHHFRLHICSTNGTAANITARRTVCVSNQATLNGAAPQPTLLCFPTEPSTKKPDQEVPRRIHGSLRVYLSGVTIMNPRGRNHLEHETSLVAEH